MDNFERFKLTEEDIKIGIDEFFTQMLVELTRNKVGRVKSLEEISSSEPKLILTVGQPGSGKTSIGKNIKSDYLKKGESVIEISSDRIAEYHRDYIELLKLPPDDCYKISREFVRAAEPKIYNEIIKNNVNIIQEKSLNKGEKDYNFLKKFIDAGYKVEINVMAVDKYESFLSCIERDIKLIELGYEPRPVAKSNHDKMYNPMLEELLEMEKNGLVDKINVYKRGETITSPKLVYSNGCIKYKNAQEAIIAARKEERKKLLNSSGEYLQRLDNAKAMIKKLINNNETLKNEIVQDIEELEKEFLKDLIKEKESHSK